MYLNGTQTGSTYTDSNSYVIGSPFIGTGFGSNNPLNGFISNLRVVNGTAAYTTTFTPSTTALTTSVSTGGSIVAISAATTTNGYYAAALGSNQNLSLAGNAIFAFGTGNFTIECWFNTSSPSITQTIYDTRSPTDTANAGYSLQINSSRVVFGTLGLNYLSGATTIIAGTWYHVAVVRTSVSNMQMFLNGVQDSAISISASQNFTNNTPRIGFGPAGYFSGFISNLRVTKDVVVYTGAFTTPTGPLAATQSSGTNIAAITGTSVSLLTCQSSTFVDNSTFSATNIITNTGAVTPAVAFGLFNNTGVSLLTAQNATFIDNSVNGVTVTNSPTPVTIQQIYGLFGTSLTGLLALQNSLTTDASINNNTLTITGSVSLEKSFSPLGEYNVPSLLTAQSGLAVDNSVQAASITNGLALYQTTVTPYGAQTPTALLTAQSNVLLSDATGYHASSNPNFASSVMLNSGAVIPVDTVHGPFNNDVPLLTFHKPLITDYSNTRTQMRSVGGGVVPTDASPFSGKSLTSLLIPYGYGDLSISNSPIANNANIASVNALINPFTIPASAVTVLGLHTSNITLESSINNGTFTTANTAPTSSTLSPFGTYNANGMILLNIGNNFANYNITASTPAPSSISNYSLVVSTTNSNIGNRDISGSSINPGAASMGYGFSYANANITIADVANSSLAESLSNANIATANYSMSYDGAVITSAGYGLPNVGNITINVTDVANSNLAESLSNANIANTNYFKSYDGPVDSVEAGMPNVGPSNVTLFISNVAGSNLAETVLSNNLGNTSYPRQSDNILSSQYVPTSIPTPVGGVILLITYSYTDGVPIVGANVQSGSGGSGTFAANTQIWTQT